MWAIIAVHGLRRRQDRHCDRRVARHQQHPLVRAVLVSDTLWVSAEQPSMDVGLRGFMLGVYNKVALGLVWSAAMAYLTSSVACSRSEAGGKCSSCSPMP